VTLKSPPDENEILELALGQGYHRNVGKMGTIGPIWDDNNEGHLFNEISKYIKENAEKIYNEEYDKL
jgi:hypothetical protein